MSEIQTPQSEQPPIIESLAPLLDQNAELTPATAEDFQAFQEQIDGIVVAYHDPGRYPEYRQVSSSMSLRQAGESDSAPRIRVVTDPAGEIEKYSNYGGAPSVRLHIDQGRKDESKRSQPTGSWGLDINMFNLNGKVVALTSGSVEQGHGRSKAHSVSNPTNSRTVSRELLGWAAEQIGDPNTLVPAETRSERRTAKWMGRLGLASRR